MQYNYYFTIITICGLFGFHCFLNFTQQGVQRPTFLLWRLWWHGQRWLWCNFLSSKKDKAVNTRNNGNFAKLEEVERSAVMMLGFVCRSFCVRTTSTSSPIWTEWSHTSSSMPSTTAGPTWTGSTTSDTWLVLRWAPTCSALAAFKLVIVSGSSS